MHNKFCFQVQDQYLLLLLLKKLQLELLKKSVIKRTEFDGFFMRLISIKSLKQDIIDFVNEKADAMENM